MGWRTRRRWASACWSASRSASLSACASPSACSSASGYRPAATPRRRCCTSCRRIARATCRSFLGSRIRRPGHSARRCRLWANTHCWEDTGCRGRPHSRAHRLRHSLRRYPSRTSGQGHISGHQDSTVGWDHHRRRTCPGHTTRPIGNHREAACCSMVRSCRHRAYRSLPRTPNRFHRSCSCSMVEAACRTARRYSCCCKSKREKNTQNPSRSRGHPPAHREGGRCVRSQSASAARRRPRQPPTPPACVRCSARAGHTRAGPWASTSPLSTLLCT